MSMDEIGMLPLNKKLSLPHPENPSAGFNMNSLLIYSDCMYRPPPLYPERERLAGIGGEVLVGFLLDYNGDIQRIQIVKSSGNTAFDQAALGAAGNSRWKAAECFGRSIPSLNVVLYRFTVCN